MSVNLALAKKRLVIMLVVDAVCLVLAGAAAVGAFVYGIDGLVWGVVAALVIGFGAQVWLIMGLRPTSGGS